MKHIAKPIIVTGGAGFIGRNIVAGLNARGHNEIIIVDHLGTTEKWKNLVGLRYEDYMDKDDFLDLLLDGQLKPVDAVIHMGACSSTTETDADYLAANNYRFTRMLCDWCLNHGIRFITASSAATYGDGAQGYSDDDAVTPGLKPLNMYGYSKHMFDLWALKNDHYKHAAGLKFFNVYGPHEDHKGDMRSVIHKAYHQICSAGEMTLFRSHRLDFADGEQKRDFIFVRDAVEVVLYLLDNREVNGLFNCGTGEARTWVDLGRALFRAMGLEPNIRFIDMPEHLRNKYQYFTQADMGKLRQTGYTKPFTSLEDGVAEYVRTHLKVV